jgi:hypothetical protein
MEREKRVSRDRRAVCAILCAAAAFIAADIGFAKDIKAQIPKSAVALPIPDKDLQAFKIPAYETELGNCGGTDYPFDGREIIKPQIIARLGGSIIYTCPADNPGVPQKR